MERRGLGASCEAGVAQATGHPASKQSLREGQRPIRMEVRKWLQKF